MALIKCSECGKRISNKAKMCVHCGNPLNEEREKNESFEEIKERILNKVLNYGWYYGNSKLF